jgi:hypothetical protein
MAGAIPSYLQPNGPTPEEQAQYNMLQALGLNLAPKAQQQLLPPDVAQQVPQSLPQVVMPADPREAHNAESKALQARTQAINDMYRAQVKQDINRQEGSIDQLGQSIAALKGKKLDANLSPLFALSDAWSGGNISKGYQAPMSEDERQKQVAALQNEITKGRYGLSQTEIEAMKTDLASQKSLMDSKQGRFDDEQLRKKETEVQTDVNKNVFKDMDTAKQQFDTLTTALSSRNVERIRGALSNYARTVGGEKGVLTDKDIERTLFPSITQLVSNAELYFDKNAQYDPADIANLENAVKAARGNATKLYSTKLDRLENQYGSRQSYAKDVMAPGGFGPQLFKQSREQFKTFYGNGEAPGGVQKISDEEYLKMTPEQRAEYKAKLGGK